MGKKALNPENSGFNAFLLLHLCNRINQFLGIFPAKAWVCNRFSVDVFSDFLGAFFNVTFNHDTFYHGVNLFGYLAVVKHFFYNSNLFLEVLVRIRMICVNDCGRVDEIHLVVHIAKTHQIFVMVVLYSIAMFADCTP